MFLQLKFVVFVRKNFLSTITRELKRTLLTYKFCFIETTQEMNIFFCLRKNFSISLTFRTNVHSRRRSKAIWCSSSTKCWDLVSLSVVVALLLCAPLLYNFISASTYAYNCARRTTLAFYAGLCIFKLLFSHLYTHTCKHTLICICVCIAFCLCCIVLKCGHFGFLIHSFQRNVLWLCCVAYYCCLISLELH